MAYSQPTRSAGERFQPAEATQTLHATPQATQDWQPIVPAYLRQTYEWAYLNARNARLLDHEWIVKTILWRQHRRLEHAVLCEINPGDSVLQAACVYGDFSPVLAEHVGPAGQLRVFDVSEVQIESCHRKLRAYPQASVHLRDLMHLQGEKADVVCCYFLMHEMPDDYKTGVMQALLNCVEPGGKVVFVDYHKPHWAHPLKPVTSIVFDLLEPYAKSLWRRELASFAHENKGQFRWRKESYFGGLYQKVVAERVS